MKVLITGSAGRVGRANFIKLMKYHEVVGIDKMPCSTVDFVGDIQDKNLINRALEGVDVVIHTAALHAPHVGYVSDEVFYDVNVYATEQLALACIKSGIKQFVFTSTTALYGYASTPEGTAGLVNEKTIPQPKSIYHKSKILAEQKLKTLSDLFALPVTILQISRCFPESADLMAMYRMTRGVDVRDVAEAHLCAINHRLRGFNRFIISGATPFTQSDCYDLFNNLENVLNAKCPELSKEFSRRQWNLPSVLDRVYDSSRAQKELSWTPKYGFESVLEMLDNELPEVLPVLQQRA